MFPSNPTFRTGRCAKHRTMGTPNPINSIWLRLYERQVMPGIAGMGSVQNSYAYEHAAESPNTGTETYWSRYFLRLPVRSTKGHLRTLASWMNSGTRSDSQRGICCFLFWYSWTAP